MKKTIFLIVILGLIQLKIIGQTNAKSVLTNDAYLENPQLYLSKLDTHKVASRILIDRVAFDDLVFNLNGNDKVSSINASDFQKVYTQLEAASYDSIRFRTPEKINGFVANQYALNRIVAMSLMDFSFNSIKQTALDSGQLLEATDFLQDNNATKNSFDTHRLIATTCNAGNITGDNFQFQLNKFLFLTNNYKQKLNTIEVDFGNGDGYRPINFDELVNVSYNDNSEYIEIKVKLTFENYRDKETEILYAHTNLYKTGSSTVPMLYNANTTISYKPELD